MQQRQLGNNGPSVGAIGLGCMSFAGFFGETTREASMATLARAVELGVTHLDTAILYGWGLSESIVGDFTAENDNDFVVASKCGIEIVDGERRLNNSRDYIRSAVEGSLERLRTDHIPLYYLHRRDQSVEIEDAIASMAELVDEGVIGGIGLSEVAPSTLERAHAVHPVAAVQSEYSLWTRQPELGMLQACARLGTAFVPFSPVARGAFAEVPPDPATFSDTDFRKPNPRFQPGNYEANQAYIDGLRRYAADRGWSPLALAVAWTLAQGDHIIPIPGTRTADHLDTLVEADSIDLGPEELAEIETILPVGFAHGYRYTPQQAASIENYC